MMCFPAACIHHTPRLDVLCVPRPPPQVFIGLVTRSNLIAILQRVLNLQLHATNAGMTLVNESGRPLQLEVSYPELNRKMLDPLSADEEHSAMEQQVGGGAGSTFLMTGFLGRKEKGANGIPWPWSWNCFCCLSSYP